MANLNEKIAALAADFANSVIASLKGASLSEILEVAPGAKVGGAKRGRGWTTRKWPKCPVCGKNAWPWGKGYCFDHAKSSARSKTAKGKKAAKAGATRTSAAKRSKPAKAASKAKSE